jgi:hypothetical protein
MRLLKTPLATVLLVLANFTLASGQVEKTTPDGGGNQLVAQTQEPANKNDSEAEQPEIWIHFAGGKRRQVAEVTEAADGFWYKVGNVTTFVDRNRVARVERRSNAREPSTTKPLHGSGNWKISDSARVESFFLNKFGRRLPLTALGQSDLHTRWGYDHRQGMDIGLHPDSAEGRGLIEFLRSEEIPFLAFREAIPGVATGPHIHVGNPSRRLYTR